MTISTQTHALSLFELIAERQVALNKTDEQVALDLGFERSTVFSMIKTGSVKLPVQKIAGLASSLEIDPARLLRLALAESMPEVLTAVDSLLMPGVLTSNELKLVESYRYLSRGRDVTPLVMDEQSTIALIVT